MKNIIKYMLIVLVIILIVCVIILVVNKKGKGTAEEQIEYDSNERRVQEKFRRSDDNYDYNEYEYASVTTEDLVKMYFNKYLSNVANDVEKAYNMLDDEYRQKRFKNLEGYKQFISENRDAILSTRLKSYIQKDNLGNTEYTEFICTDQNDNFYTIRETAIMQIKFILDDHTLETEEFLEKYNSTEEEGKVALNIQRFVDALNTKDYEYAYNCLSDGFKDNYFKNIEDFKKYVNEKLYDNISLHYLSYSSDNGLHRYTVVMAHSGDQVETIQKTIIMKLNEGTNFEMSFNI